MLEGKRMAVALGGLGATVLLGLGASFAIGGEQSRTDQVRAQLHGGQAEERDLLPRRRDGHAGDHRRPLLPVRRGRADERRPAAVHRLPDHVVGEAGRRPATCPTTTRTRPPPARCGRPGRRRSTSGSRRARARRSTCPARTSRPCSSRRSGRARRPATSRRRRSPTRRRRCSTRTSRCAAARARRTWRRLPDGDEGRGRPRLDRRADRRPSRRRRPRRRPRPLHADDHRRPRRRQDRRAVGRPPGLHRGHRRRGARRGARGRQAAARPVQRRQHDDRVDRAGGHARRRHAGAEVRHRRTGRRTSRACPT